MNWFYVNEVEIYAKTLIYAFPLALLTQIIVELIKAFIEHRREKENEDK